MAAKYSTIISDFGVGVSTIEKGANLSSTGGCVERRLRKDDITVKFPILLKQLQCKREKKQKRTRSFYLKLQSRRKARKIRMVNSKGGRTTSWRCLCLRQASAPSCPTQCMDRSMLRSSFQHLENNRRSPRGIDRWCSLPMP